jgi:hypothetical protein
MFDRLEFSDRQTENRAVPWLSQGDSPSSLGRANRHFPSSRRTRYAYQSLGLFQGIIRFYPTPRNNTFLHAFRVIGMAEPSLRDYFGSGARRP